MHDHRPHAEIIVSHLRGWMCVSGTPSDSPDPSEDDWQAHLSNARNWFIATGESDLQAVTEQALRLAETGAVGGILTLLAHAETAAARRRRR
ncbi:hypothetical protein [Streptomyces capitiformicae]|uniref:hypothetical protein n=1 Tax=Streptomyces capitiformicae TaxID=2014920 RepID=UPI001673AE41|nr:hypothetical protein [Streptomyces capitiformicae]